MAYSPVCIRILSFIIISSTAASCSSKGPAVITVPADTLSLIFTGDIMGHDAQISSAWDDSLKKYDYDDVFHYIRPALEEADFAIGNFEVTLGGVPYKGYPQFSSPDEWAVACKNAGFDFLMTANNHACDRGRKGIIRTLNILDSLQIGHTGTFRDSAGRRHHNLLILEKDSIRIGILNYTYGTNGLPVPHPALVNLLDTLQMGTDVSMANASGLHKLVVFVHWGTEYNSFPDREQIKFADFLFRKGVDIIIGSHPHVIQKMELYTDSITRKQRFIAWSLGNFVSDQRTIKRDGGAAVTLKIVKDQDSVFIADAGYLLTWVYKPVINSHTRFRVIPCASYDIIPGLAEDSTSSLKCRFFMTNTREFLTSENVNVQEISNSKTNTKMDQFSLSDSKK